MSQCYDDFPELMSDCKEQLAAKQKQAARFLKRIRIQEKQIDILAAKLGSRVTCGDCPLQHGTTLCSVGNPCNVLLTEWSLKKAKETN